MNHATSVITLGLALLVSASARAESTLAPVRVDASSQVVLERVDSSGDTHVVCRAPCDQPLETSAKYRINGDDIRPSNVFTVAPETSAIAAHPRSSGGLTTGIVLLAISAAFTIGGVAAIVAPFVISPYGDLSLQLLASAFVATPLFVASLATGVPGTILVVNHFQSTADSLSPPRVAPSRPIVSFAF